MFSSKHFIEDVNDIPATWIFENYLGLSEPLTGQRVRTHSLFNPNDRTPSMYLYYNRDTEDYRYKCFSTGIGGSAVDLMMRLWKLDFADTFKRISKDYTDYLKSGKTCETRIIEHSVWKVSEFKTRKWNKDDADYWSAYNISSTLLEHYNVVPLSSYTMQKVSSKNEVEEQFTVSGKHIYGYFTNDFMLYKIYQPKKKDRKFIKVCDYVQGYDQLENKPYLIITSSLKDCLALKSMGLEVDVVAPDSENTMLSEDVMEEFLQEYDAVVTMFDSDQAGIKAMQVYRKKYLIPFVYFPMEKDIADAVKAHGVRKTLLELVPKLHRALELYDEIEA